MAGNLSDSALRPCQINFASFGSVALYGRRERGQAPTLPVFKEPFLGITTLFGEEPLNLIETYNTVPYPLVPPVGVRGIKRGQLPFPIHYSSDTGL